MNGRNGSPAQGQFNSPYHEAIRFSRACSSKVLKGFCLSGEIQFSRKTFKFRRHWNQKSLFDVGVNT